MVATEEKQSESPQVVQKTVTPHAFVPAGVMGSNGDLEHFDQKHCMVCGLRQDNSVHKIESK